MPWLPSAPHCPAESGTDSLLQLSETSVSASLSSLLSLNLDAQAKKTTPLFPAHTLSCLCFPSVGLPSCPHSLHWLKLDPFQVSTETPSWFSSMINHLLFLGAPGTRCSHLWCVSSLRQPGRHCLPRSLPTLERSLSERGHAHRTCYTKACRLLGLWAQTSFALLRGTQNLAITLEAKSFRADRSGPSGE